MINSLPYNINVFLGEKILKDTNKGLCYLNDSFEIIQRNPSKKIYLLEDNLSENLLNLLREKSKQKCEIYLATTKENNNLLNKVNGNFNIYELGKLPQPHFISLDSSIIIEGRHKKEEPRDFYIRLSAGDEKALFNPFKRIRGLSSIYREDYFNKIIN